MSSMVTGFQVFSEKTCDPSVNLASSRTEAKDEVMTTRFTPGAEAWRALRIPVVPMTAGSMRSFLGSSAHVRQSFILE